MSGAFILKISWVIWVKVFSIRGFNIDRTRKYVVGSTNDSSGPANGKVILLPLLKIVPVWG